MFNLKKLLAIMLAIVLVFCAASCGESKNPQISDRKFGKVSFVYEDKESRIPENKEQFNEYCNEMVMYKSEEYEGVLDSVTYLGFHIVYEKENAITANEMENLNLMDFTIFETESLLYQGKMHISAKISVDNPESRERLMDFTANDKVEKIIFSFSQKLSV